MYKLLVTEQSQDVKHSVGNTVSVPGLAVRVVRRALQILGGATS